MDLSALALNCTLKKSGRTSNTQALLDKAGRLFAEHDVAFDTIRVIDHDVPHGVSSDEGGGDEWPAILERVKAADILVIGTPIWFGVRSSVCQKVVERLDATYDEADPETGQFPLYGKVGGVVVTGNEDGAHDAAANTLFNLTVWFARLLKENPIPTNLKALYALAQQESGKPETAPFKRPDRT